LIAQGIQKGIDLYKKQQKEKARAFNKRFKKAPPQKEGLPKRMSQMPKK
jgi:hypothetical protein